VQTTQWLLVESVSHYSGGTVPDSHRVPFPLARLPRESSIGQMPPSSAVAVDLDVLGDVGPLWHAWLEDAARRARVAELEPGSLDEQLPNWRGLLQHFAEDYAPVYLRPSAPVTTALRRLQAGGAEIGVFTGYPEELARLALAHLGASRRVGELVCGEDAEARLLALLGPARVVRTASELDW
jgi:hypothetical protein